MENKPFTKLKERINQSLKRTYPSEQAITAKHVTWAIIDAIDELSEEEMELERVTTHRAKVNSTIPNEENPIKSS